MQKRRHSNDDNEVGPSKVVAVNPPNPVAPIIEQTGEIFKLDIDCYEESFDYFPFEDLVNVGKTCKRLQQVAGYCFQENYLGCATFDSNGIRYNEADVKHFALFMHNIHSNADGLCHLLDVRSQLRRLELFQIEGMESVHINRLKEISIPKLENLIIGNCDLGTKFHEIIDHFPKLNHLEIDSSSGEFNWLDRKYPTLEYFKLDPDDDETIEGIPEFLELNPNIRKFATTAESLGQNKDKFMSSDVKLDDLAIDYGYIHGDEFELKVDAVNKLHERGFYKKLQLYFMAIKNQDLVDQFVTIKGLVKLYVFADSEGYPFTFSAFKNLEEFRLFDTSFVADLEIMANNLINLKRIHFCHSSIDDIMPFIRRSVEMQRIQVDELKAGIHFNEDTLVIDLLALNRARERLTDAAKITLYVEEKIYLATKWAMKETDFGLIRLKRNDSVGWNHDYYN